MSADAEPRLLLKEKMETFLAALAAYYKKANEDVLLEIVVLSSHRVEHWSHDNWDGGIDGVALYLEVPENTFHKVVGQVEEAAGRIAKDLGQFVNVQGEFVERVFLEPMLGHDANWRAAFGSIVAGSTTAPDMQTTDAGHLWRQTSLRVFVSHKAEHKKVAAQIKADLDELGAACFVAHEDIEPTREWQLEIEKALFSMECFVALLTEGFHDSLWTDQEIGVAVGRRTPVVPVRFGCDPYGFIGKYQAVLVPHDATDSDVSLRIASAILLLPVVSGRFVEGYIERVRESRRFTESERLARLLPHLNKLEPEHVKGLCEAFNSNRQVSDSYAFNGGKRGTYGGGLPEHLRRITGSRYEVNGDPKRIDLVGTA